LLLKILRTMTVRLLNAAEIRKEYTSVSVPGWSIAECNNGYITIDFVQLSVSWKGTGT
jgi:hypothetical protein